MKKVAKLERSEKLDEQNKIKNALCLLLSASYNMTLPKLKTYFNNAGIC